MSDVTVFVGPTLPVEQAREHLDARYLPPASRGDVYRAARQQPWGIAIIDGYFAQEPAVWHKEILWAMAEGVHVFGAASMGALRAAELAAYGMCGVGEIFEAYRDGRCEDDDEVTVVHGTEASGYRHVSEAMVNIRATLRRAVDEHVIRAATRRRLEAAGKALFYADRDYSALLAIARRGGEDEHELARLRAWLPDHQVNQKRVDAISLLTLIRERRQQASGPLRTSYHFERTDAWEEMVRQCGEHTAATGEAELPVELIVEELRLLGGPAVRAAMVGALARHLAVERAQAHGATATRELFSDTLNGFFLERGLRSPEQIRAWLVEHDLDAEGLTRFMQEQSLVRWASVMFGVEAELQLRNHLHTTPEYERIVRRAGSKRRCLLERASRSLLIKDPVLTAEDLVAWFFEARLGQVVPSDLDACAWERGFPDRHALLEALRREHVYVTHAEAGRR
ncbi:MAG: hypothetical protein JW751_02620 [Polyangiaceae bacterium]|nr:hypothetical protein [Polyangiaceae bacterium]